MGSYEHINCNICGSDDTHLLYNVPECTGFYKGESFNLVRCKKCNLVYINPRPKQDDIAKYYPSDYYAHVDKLYKLA
jgi:hypothetical protein